jgi:hypothetical protein
MNLTEIIVAGGVVFFGVVAVAVAVTASSMARLFASSEPHEA